MSGELIPGRPWLQGLDKGICSSKTAMVLIGKDGLGPWEIPEMEVCLNKAVQKSLPVIPVLLPGAAEKPELPIFLARFTWVDLRDIPRIEGLNKLQWGITGIKPDDKIDPEKEYNSQICNLLWSLDYSQEKDFIEIRKRLNPVSSFLIRANHEPIKHWLITRLAQKIPGYNESIIYEYRLSLFRDVEEVFWKGISKELGVSFDPDKIRQKIIEKCRERTVIIVVHGVHWIPREDLAEILDQFWRPLTTEIQGKKLPFGVNLSLLFVGDIEGRGDCYNLCQTNPINLGANDTAALGVLTEIETESLEEWFTIDAAPILEKQLGKAQYQQLGSIIRNWPRDPLQVMERICDVFGD